MPTENKNSKPAVSVIVTTRNEEPNISRCLSSVKTQTYPSELIEIIVADNNSTDSTREIALSYTSKVFTFGPERSAQRNFGARNAGGEFLLFLDADMILSEKVIEECVTVSCSRGYVALYIPEKIIGEGYWIAVRNFERSFYDSTVIDCVRFVRRAEFFKVNGFDESLTGPEDWDFDRRIKATGVCGIIQSALFHNEGKFGVRKYLRKKSYYAGNFSAYISKWGKGDKVIRKQFGVWYRYFGVFMEHGKVRRLIFKPHLALGMFFLRFLVGVVYLGASRKVPPGKGGT